MIVPAAVDLMNAPPPDFDAIRLLNVFPCVPVMVVVPPLISPYTPPPSAATGLVDAVEIEVSVICVVPFEVRYRLPPLLAAVLVVEHDVNDDNVSVAVPCESMYTPPPFVPVLHDSNVIAVFDACVTFVSAPWRVTYSPPPLVLDVQDLN